MPATLFLDAKTGAGGTTCAAWRYVNASPTQIGDTFGVSYDIAVDKNHGNRNGIIQFQGELYAIARDGVYKKNDPTSMVGGWTSQITFTVQAGFGDVSGLHPFVVGGATILAGVFKTAEANGAWRWVKFDGATWTQAPGFTTGMISTHVTDEIVYRNTLHVIGVQVGFVAAMTFDPSTNAFSIIAFTGFSAVGAGPSLCIFQDRLFGLFQPNPTTQHVLAEFTAGSWSFAQNVGPAYSSQLIDNGKQCLFTDGTNMYAMTVFPGGGTAANTGWNAWQLDAALAETPLTLTTLPQALIAVNSGGTHPAMSAAIASERMYAVYDVDSVTGTLSIGLFFAASSTSGTGFTLYQWNGPGVLMTPVDVGGDVFHSPPSGYPNNGERIWTAGELDIKITARAAVLGGEQISFIAYGGGTLRKMKLYYALLGEPNLVEATLAAPVTGGSATFNGGLNQVEGIAADGATVYSIIWNASADGVSVGQRATRIPQVFV